MLDRPFRGISVFAGALCLGLLGAGSAGAATYDVGLGTLIVDVSNPKNDPAPDDLICVGNPDDGGLCGDANKDPPAAVFYETVDINTQALAKYDVPSEEDPGGWDPDLDVDNFDITLDESGKNGTWSQTVVAGALLTRYVAVKAGPMWSLYEIILPPILLAGDVLSGTWTSATAFLENKELSHLSLYDSIPRPPGQQHPVPLPVAFPLFATALGGLGLLGWRRKRKAAAAAA